MPCPRMTLIHVPAPSVLAPTLASAFTPTLASSLMRIRMHMHTHIPMFIHSPFTIHMPCPCHPSLIPLPDPSPYSYLLCYSPILLPYNNALLYCSPIIMLSCTALLYCSPVLLSCTALLYCSPVLLSSTARLHTLSSTALLSYSPLVLLSSTALLSYSHTLLSYSTLLAPARPDGTGLLRMPRGEARAPKASYIYVLYHLCPIIVLHLHIYSYHTCLISD